MWTTSEQACYVVLDTLHVMRLVEVVHARQEVATTLVEVALAELAPEWFSPRHELEIGEEEDIDVGHHQPKY